VGDLFYPNEIMFRKKRNLLLTQVVRDAGMLGIKATAIPQDQSSLFEGVDDSLHGEKTLNMRLLLNQE